MSHIGWCRVRIVHCSSGIASGVYSVVVTGTSGDTGSTSFTVTNSPPTVSGLSQDKLSPQVVGTTVTWTCSASDPEVIRSSIDSGCRLVRVRGLLCRTGLG